MQSLKSVFPAHNTQGMVYTDSSHVALFGGPQSQPYLNPDIDSEENDADATFGNGNQDLLKKKMMLGAMEFDDAEQEENAYV